jgi:hypothetical protein
VTQFRTFTDAERAALKLHGLDIHRPSQLADAFVLGMRYANEQAAQSPAPALPDVLFDGYSVLQAMNEDARKRTSPENVSDVLDAVVRLLKSPAPAAPAPLRMLTKDECHELAETVGLGSASVQRMFCEVNNLGEPK